MNKLLKTTGFISLIIFMLTATSCLKHENKGRTEDTEKSEISSFLSGLINGGENVDTTAAGIYYVIYEEGAGQVPQPGDTVSIEYVGSFIDGTIFDTSESHYVNGIWKIIYKEESAIEGFDESIAIMKKGMEADFIIPSKLAYGPYWYDFIPPYTPLIFHMKLHDLKPKIVE